MKGDSDVVLEYNNRNHPIVVKKVAKKLLAKSGGVVIAKTDKAYLLEESGHKPVYYFPISDVRSDVLEPTDTVSTCPFKGRAHYYSLLIGDRKITDAVWQYSEPSDEFTAIGDYVAFYDKAIDGIEEIE
ncbi:MAG TPA: DUF427 domain-containing protein [Thermoplasmataceae archaeon]|nr:DUF427 domain-containing protein [Thermoplasmataceae archaeon]